MTFDMDYVRYYMFMGILCIVPLIVFVPKLYMMICHRKFRNRPFILIGAGVLAILYVLINGTVYLFFPEFYAENKIAFIFGLPWAITVSRWIMKGCYSVYDIIRSLLRREVSGPSLWIGLFVLLFCIVYVAYFSDVLADVLGHMFYPWKN